MCGIFGIFGSDPQKMQDALCRMSLALHHRGPDAEDHWFDLSVELALGHRRLAILELSAAGAQPMTSACGRYVIVFNGEIYNHMAMRKQISTGFVWRGGSDTETIVEAINFWGLVDALKRAKGMFAFALWDQRDRVLHLGRDRLGEKPLYFARVAGGWAFGSELKALMALPSFRPRLNRDAIAAYLAYGYVPDTQCVFEGVRKVPPGHTIALAHHAAEPVETPFEQFEDLVAVGLEQRRAGSAGSAQAHLEKTLLEVVAEQMLSDVPLGCLLSGGIDSSLIASLMQTQSTRPVRTYSIGFNEARFNEAPHAAAVARHLRTEHTEFILSDEDALAVVPDLPNIYDEPFADSSQIPSVLLCRNVRRNVTVCLTGDGGDEMFGGYNRHVLGPPLMRRIRWLPRGLKRQLGVAVASLGPLLSQENSWLRRLGSRVRLPVTALDKAASLGPVLSEVDTIGDLYRHFTCAASALSVLNRTEALSHWPDPNNISERLPSLDAAEWMMAMDSCYYLPSDILVKVDRAAMSASLETRAPLLDPRIVAAAWALPSSSKIANGLGKHPLRQLLYKHVPRDLIERPKQGFAIPLDRWLRGALRTWAETLLNDEEAFALLHLNQDEGKRLWQVHQAGLANHGQVLWTVLMLLAWLAKYRNFLDCTYEAGESDGNMSRQFTASLSS